jgi:hypothetical protein
MIVKNQMHAFDLQTWWLSQVFKENLLITYNHGSQLFLSHTTA